MRINRYKTYINGLFENWFASPKFVCYDFFGRINSRTIESPKFSCALNSAKIALERCHILFESTDNSQKTEENGQGSCFDENVAHKFDLKKCKQSQMSIFSLSGWCILVMHISDVEFSNTHHQKISILESLVNVLN